MHQMMEVREQFLSLAVINKTSPAPLKNVSWFPPPNKWRTSGYNVGQWTHECERWFKGHVAKIHAGTFKPLSSEEWRTDIRATRAAVKLTYQMNKAADDYIPAHRDIQVPILHHSPSHCGIRSLKLPYIDCTLWQTSGYDEQQRLQLTFHTG